MPAAIPAVIGGGLSLLGAKKAAKGADADRAQQQQALDRLAGVEFDPQSIFGPSGLGFDFDTMVASLGDFAPFQDMFGGLAESGIGQGFDIQQGALGAGLPVLEQLFGGASGLAGQSLADIQNFEGTDFLQDVFSRGIDFAGGQLGQASAEGAGIRALAQQLGLGGAGLGGEGADLRNLGVDMLNRGDPARATGLDFGLGGAASVFGRGSDLFNRGDFFADEAQQGFESLRADTLSTLRERDREGEDRAAAGLADELFGTGRLGTTGGGRDISDFAQGLARADLDRQLAATGEARAARESSGNLASLFGQLGTGVTSLAPNIFNAGTNMFAQGNVMDQLGLGVLGAGTDITNAGTALSSLMPQLINAGTGVSGLEALPLKALGDFGANFGMAQELEDALLNNAFNRFGSTAGLTNDLFGGIMNLGSGLIGQGGNALQTALGLESLPLDFAEFGANLGATQANTDIAAAGGQANVAANFNPTGSDLLAGGLSTLGSNIFQSAGGFDTISDAIGNIFRPKPTPGGK
jgi:hypothetical protein